MPPFRNSEGQLRRLLRRPLLLADPSTCDLIITQQSRSTGRKTTTTTTKKKTKKMKKKKKKKMMKMKMKMKKNKKKTAKSDARTR